MKRTGWAYPISSLERHMIATGRISVLQCRSGGNIDFQTILSDIIRPSFVSSLNRY